MVISGVNTVTYNGDGITTAWPYTFSVTDDSEIRVQLNNADGTAVIVESDYYVDLINSTVYYPGYAPGSEPPEAEQPPKVQEGQTITVYREIPITQESDLGEKWPFEVIEKGLDKLTMIAQQIDSGTKRTIDNALASMELLADVVVDSDELQHITDQYNAIDANAAAAAESEENAAASATAAATSASGAANSALSASNTAAALTAYLDDKESLTAPAIDATLSIEGAAADAKATGQIDTNLNSLTNGANASYTVTSNGYKYIYLLMINGLSYVFEHNMSVACNLHLVRKDGTTNNLTGNVPPNTKYLFYVDEDDYVGIRFYANATGTATVYNSFSVAGDVRTLETYNTIPEHPGYINASGGITTQSATVLEVYTDKFLVSPGCVMAIDLSYSTAKSMWAAYATYDQNGDFIERIVLDAGIERTHSVYSATIGSGIKYIAFTYRTFGIHTVKFLSSNITALLCDRIDDLKATIDWITDNVITTNPTVKSINHRGYNTVAPENTLPAYKLSKKNGFNIVETDVAFTSDGVAVLLHDGTINRTARNTDGTEIDTSISIGAITYAQALQYDFGIWKSPVYAGTKIPTFTQFIRICRNLGLEAYIELKPTGTTEARVQGLIDEVRKHGMENFVTWISFYPNLLEYVKDYDGHARLGLVTESVTETTISTALSLKTNDNEVFIDSDVYDSSAVTLCYNSSLPLEAWTINNETTMNALDAYITGVTSDVFVYAKVLYDKNID